MVLTPHYDSDFRNLAGKTIKEVVHMSKEMYDDMMWYCEPVDTTMLVFTDNTVAVVSADPEGNGPGFLFFGELK